mmetsp:Transcript_6736/g.25286  ORF Transcript_6736/g.25286 Transcript_6736/m.25286 type:complete len:272 (-) Transcript_6736:100-915(-)
MPETISVAATLKKATPVVPAIACANFVFPEPGGPCSSTPVGGDTPRCAKTSGCNKGWTMSCFKSSKIESMPPRSSKRSSGRSSGEKPPNGSALPSPCSRRAAARAARSCAECFCAFFGTSWTGAAAALAFGLYIRLSEPFSAEGSPATEAEAAEEEASGGEAAPAEEACAAGAVGAEAAGSCSAARAGSSCASPLFLFLPASAAPAPLATTAAAAAGAASAGAATSSAVLSSCEMMRLSGCCFTRLYSGNLRHNSSRTLSLPQLWPELASS